MKKRRYPLNIDVELFEKFKLLAKKEYKLINPKIIELIYNFVKENGNGMSKKAYNSNIFDTDFEVIDRLALKTKTIKKNHIAPIDNRVPHQGSPCLKNVSTLEEIKKNL